MNKAAAETVRQLDVSRETFERLESYADLLRKWNARINLVSGASLSELWTRHILDSAQLLTLAPASGNRWIDLGSGGGFPGAVVAILAAEKQPNLIMTLVESDQRKATFLRAVSRETGVPMAVLAQRIEDIPPLEADVISARALAPLIGLLAHAERHLADGGVALFPKGANVSKEIAAALERWRFRCETLTSQTDKEAVILRIGDIERV